MGGRGVSSQEIVEQRYSSKKSDEYKGAIDYMGEKIAQWHNPRIFIDDLMGENKTKQFTSVMLIGTPGTGKTTLATFIGHQIHTRSPNYYVQHFTRKDLLKFDTVIQELPKGRDVVLIFDDVSLIFKDILNPAQKNKILQTLTEARHPAFEKTDRKVFVIVNVHYENSMEKMWRSQGSWKIYTDMSADEADVFNGKTKSRYINKVNVFMRTVLDQLRKEEFVVSLTANLNREYTINEPFRFIMVYDTIDVKFYLVPEEYCALCSEHGQHLKKHEATPKEIDQLICNYYGEKDGRAGMKLALTNAGILHQFRNKPVYAYNLAYDLLAHFDVDKEALATYYRTLAQITDKRLHTPRRKNVNFFEDLLAIRAKNVSPLGNLGIIKRIDDEIDLNL